MARNDGRNRTEPSLGNLDGGRCVYRGTYCVYIYIYNKSMSRAYRVTLHR